MLPNTLIYLTDRLAGFSTNFFKINPVGSTSVNSRGIIEFLLPSNAPINMGSFKVNFTATVSGASAGGRLPADIHSLIQRVEVSAGGILISSGSDYYNVLLNAKQALMGSKACPVSGHPEIVRSVPYYTGGSTITSTGPEAIVSATNQVFTWENFDGFLSTVQPTVIDTGLVPQMRVRITLAGPEVLSSVAGVALSGTGSADIVDDGSGAADYSLSNISAIIEGISFGDDTYNQMTSALIAKKGYLEIPYKNYYSFNGSHTGSSQFNVATQSLDRIYWCFRASGFDTQGAPVVVSGHKIKGAFISSIAASYSNASDIGLPGYDIGGTATFNNNSEKYIGKYFNFVDPKLSSDVSTFTGQLKLNNSSYPDFQATATEWLGISKNSLPDGEKLRTMSSLQYLNNFFVGCCRLNHVGSEKMRLVSGLDTRGVNLSGSFNTVSITSANLSIFLETTSTLQLGSGRQISVVF